MVAARFVAPFPHTSFGSQRNNMMFSVFTSAGFTIPIGIVARSGIVRKCRHNRHHGNQQHKKDEQ